VHSPATVTPHRAPAARATAGGHDIGALGLYSPPAGPRRTATSPSAPSNGSTPSTTLSRYRRTGAGFRFDHVLVSTPHADQVLTCDYHQEACEAGLTDHAVMTLRLALQTPAGP
jgi:hypothetical protein